MPGAAAVDGFDDSEGAEGAEGAEWAGGVPREEGSRIVNGLVGMTESSALAFFFSYLERNK